MTVPRSLAAIVAALCMLPATARAQADADPVSLIEAIYQTYQDNKLPLTAIYSRRLQALIDQDDKETPEGMVGRIDWDVFINGQAWELSELKIVPVSQSATQAQVRATFKNFDKPSDMLFDLIVEDGHWRIDDVEKTLRPRWTMSKILSDAPDAFPDAKAGE